MKWAVEQQLHIQLLCPPPAFTAVTPLPDIPACGFWGAQQRGPAGAPVQMFSRGGCAEQQPGREVSADAFPLYLQLYLPLSPMWQTDQFWSVYSWGYPILSWAIKAHCLQLRTFFNFYFKYNAFMEAHWCGFKVLCMGLICVSSVDFFFLFYFAAKSSKCLLTELGFYSYHP